MFSSWQLGRKTIKRIRIAGIIFAVLAFLWYLPVLLFQFELGRKGGANYLAKELSQALGTEVELDEVSITLSGDIKAHRLLLRDSLGAEMLSASNMVVDFGITNLWDYLSDERLELDHIRLFKPTITLKEDSLGGLNINAVLKHLQSQESKQKSELKLSIFSILIRDASCRYYKKDSLLWGVKELDCKLDELLLNEEKEQGVSVRELSFALSNGFRVKSFSTSIRQTKDSLKVKDLDLLFGESQINIPSFYLNLKCFGLAKLDSLDIAQINVALKDLEAFEPRLSAFEGERLKGRGKIQAEQKGINCKDLELRIDKLFAFDLKSGKLKLDIWGKLLGFESSDIKLKVKPNLWAKLKDLELEKDNNQLFEDLGLLGAWQWQGRVDWRKGIRLKTSGAMQTKVGNLDFDSDAMFSNNQLLNLGVNLGINEINLETFRQKAIDLKVPKLDLNLNLYRSKLDEPWTLSSELSMPTFQFKGKSYEALKIFGSGTENYKLALSLDDENVQVKTLLGFRYNEQGLRDIKLDYDLNNIVLADWGIKDKHQKRAYKLNGNLSLTRASLQESDVELKLKQFSWQEPKQASKSLEDIHLAFSQKAKSGTDLIVQAPWLKALIRTNAPFEHLPQKIKYALYRQMPIIAHWGTKGLRRKNARALVDIKLDSLPTALNDLIALPISTQKAMAIKGEFDEKADKFALLFEGDNFNVADYNFQKTKVQFAENSLLAKGDISLNETKEWQGICVDLSQRNNDLVLNLDLGIDESGAKNGEVNANIQIASPKDFPKALDELNLLVYLRKSKLLVNKIEWDLSPAELFLSKDRTYVKGLNIKSKDKSLAIGGAISSNPQDSLHVQLKNMSLLYILTASKVDFTLLDAELSGDLYAKLKDDVFYAYGDVKSKEFFVEGYDAGASNLHLDWDSKDNFLGINGHLGDYPKAYTKANGGINLDNDSGIDILFSAKKLNVGFIQAFTDGFLSKLNGQATGDIRLFGVFREGVTIEGEAELDKAEVGIKSLGVAYRFSDKLKFDADKMIFPNIKLTDERGQTAMFDGSIKHHNFDDMDIRLDFKDLDNFKVLKNDNVRTLPVCGEAYCSGEASLTGGGSKLLLSLNAKTEAPTDLSIDINALNTVWKDQSLMRFVNLRDSIQQPKPSEEDIKKHSQSLLDMQFDLDIDADTQLAIRIGNNRNDEIKAKGEGRLQINVPFIGDQTIYGDFKLLSGDYTLRLENLTNKKFKVRSGSMLNFRGNPAQANINIDAIYSLTANISDLDEGLSFGTRRTNMPVNCVLNLSGELASPKIGFGIALPKASGEVERRVKSLLSTEEAMTRQTLALISIGKFMPSAYGKSKSDGTNNWSALASTTISEQLSALIGDLSEKIQLGTNIKTSNEYFTDTEIELLFSGQLFNNRLLISGNVGYHDNPFLSNTYIGEFDLEYKLNKAGSLRLKGYNHYNNSYQYIRKGLTTQGFGLLFRKRFDKLSDLFTSKKKPRNENKIKSVSK